jgi:hypothetical protein
MNTLNQSIIDATNKAYSFKTKAARSKAWDKVQELVDLSYDEVKPIAESYNGQVAEFTVTHVFTDSIQCYNEKLGSYNVSKCNDILSKSWYPETSCIDYTKGQVISVTLFAEVTKHFKHEYQVVGITLTKVVGGVVNESKYAELCKNENLAFFKYPGSEGVTGLGIDLF